MIAKLKSVIAINWKPLAGELNGKQVQWSGLLIFVFFFVLSLTKVGSFTLDEILFHYPNVVNFYENGLGAAFNARYSAANTPLPYIIVAEIARLTGPSLVLARITTGMLSFFTFLMAMKLLKRHGADNYSAFVILFYPYFFVNSFVFYAVNYGLFFALLALLVLDNKKDKDAWFPDFLAGVCLSLAVLCQQFYLVMPAAIAFSKTILVFRQKEGTLFRRLIKVSISNLLLFLPLTVPGLLFVKWKGLTHPNFHVHSLSFFPSTITAVLFVSGFIFLPYLIQSYKKIKAPTLFFAAVGAALLVLFFKPAFSDFQGPGLFTGITYHLLTLAGVISPAITTLLMMGLACCGILFYTLLFKSLSSQWDYVLFAICMFLVLGYAANTQIGERHLLALIIFLFLLVLPRIRRPVAIWYPGVMAVLGIGYFVYWTFFKYGAA